MFWPKHNTCWITEAVAISCVGCVSVMEDEFEQPLLSVVISVYVPPVRPLMFCVLAVKAPGPLQA